MYDWTGSLERVGFIKAWKQTSIFLRRLLPVKFDHASDDSHLFALTHLLSKAAGIDHM